jgi:diguanylate cyclase (GGDEF)-like protein
LAVGFGLVAALGAIDYLTGSEVSFSVFYLGPVLYVTWYAGLGAGAAMALASAAMWGVIDVAAGSHYSIWVIPVWNSATRLGFFLVAASLLHSLQRASRTVLALAHTDSLTGLANGRSFYNDLEREIRRQRRYGSAFTLAYVDLDHFKEVNDARGHAAGDDLLRCVGACIAAAIRESDVVARLGGDEFGVLLPETGEESASPILSRVLVTVARTMGSSAPGIDGAGLTVGAVVFTAAPESADAAVRAADEAMYEGKRVARGGLQLRIWPS